MTGVKEELIVTFFAAEVPLQPLASVTVTVKLPAALTVIVGEVDPVDQL